MLTTRGLVLLMTVLALLTAALVLEAHLPLALVAFALLLWFLGEWFLFTWRVRTLVRQIAVERAVRDERGPVANLWAGRLFEVRVTVRLASWLGLPYVLVADRVPFGIERLDGSELWEGSLGDIADGTVSYRIRCKSPGRVRFEGLALHLADLQGFFYYRTFLPAVAEFRVLPVLVDVDSHAPVVKRFNLLPPPGIHRHRHAGSGSELLDLRDYMPGDPPRMIAWKVSARRDRLITKEFESDVPIRCTLFVDTSNSVRLGPPGQNPLARMVEIAAAVAQASTGNRDPVGLGLFDETQMRYLKPARTRRHLTEVLNLLADAAGTAPTTGGATADELLPLGHAFAQEVYPDLLRPEVNAFPGWLAWLQPRSLWTMRRPTASDALYWLLPVLTVVLGGLLLWIFARAWLALARWLGNAPSSARVIAVGVLTLAGLAMFLVLVRLLLLLFPKKRRVYRWRKEMAALLSVQHGLAPGGLALLLEDDRRFAEHTQRFLIEHHVPVPLPLYNEQGRYLFASPRKVTVVADTLVRAVGKGRDNELFVILADLLELGDQLAPLLRAVKVTLARHHQVVVICPWPPGVAPPLTAPPPPAPGGTLDHTIRQSLAQRFHQAFFDLRRAFARLGVPVICAQGSDPAQLIMDRLDRLRSVRSTPKWGSG